MSRCGKETLVGFNYVVSACVRAMLSVSVSVSVFVSVHV